MVRERLAQLTLACCLSSLVALGVLAIAGAETAAVTGGIAAIGAALLVAATAGVWHARSEGAERPLLEARCALEDVALIDEGESGIDSLWRIDVRVTPSHARARWSPTDLDVVPLTPMLLVAEGSLLASASPLVESGSASIERVHVLDDDDLPAPPPAAIDGEGRLRLIIAAPPDARKLRLRHDLDELGELDLPVEGLARTAPHVEEGEPVEAS